MAPLPEEDILVANAQDATTDTEPAAKLPNNLGPHKPSSMPGFTKYPKFRQLDIYNKTAFSWLESKRECDEIGEYWRVDDKLYDLRPFISKHPGGSDWLTLTKGTDVTELFETSHFGNTARAVLSKYYVKDIDTPRNSPYTFEENGFYRKLKERVAPILEKVGRGPSLKMKLIMDLLVVGVFVTMVLATRLDSIILITVSGVILGMAMICSHNFFHQKDNWRMYYFDLSFISHQDWRISHAISHHIYPNTIQDWEIGCFEPTYCFLPQDKTAIQRMWVFFYFHGANFTVMLYELFTRLNANIKGNYKFRWFHYLPFTELVVLLLTSPTGSWNALFYFLLLHLISSFWFMTVGLTVGHHHPENFHDGDAPREDLDWGLCQLDAIKDRIEISGNLLLTSTMFGDHALHHLFPTVDHSKLPYLYPALEATCEEFGVDYRVSDQIDAYWGCFAQLLRNKPNPVPPPKPRNIQKNHKD